MKILMVCLGNICRSPLAEGIMKDKISQKDLDWKVESRGTGSWHAGNVPDSRSVAVAKDHNLDITDQRAQQLEKSDLQGFDLIYAMDTSNYRDILAMAENEEQTAKVKMILNESEPGINKSVPDPFYGDDGFEQVYQMLDEACEIALQRLMEET